MGYFIGPSIVNGEVLFRLWDEGIIVFQDKDLKKVEAYKVCYFEEPQLSAPKLEHCEFLTKIFDVSFSEKTIKNASKKVIHITDLTGEIKAVALIQETVKDVRFKYINGIKTLIKTPIHVEKVHILFLGVSEDCRELGYGKKILTKITSDYPNIPISTNINIFNTTSLNFFTSQGFRFKSLNTGKNRFFYFLINPNSLKTTKPTRTIKTI